MSVHPNLPVIAPGAGQLNGLFLSSKNNGWQGWQKLTWQTASWCPSQMAPASQGEMIQVGNGKSLGQLVSTEEKSRVLSALPKLGSEKLSRKENSKTS